MATQGVIRCRKDRDLERQTDRETYILRAWHEDSIFISFVSPSSASNPATSGDATASTSCSMRCAAGASLVLAIFCHEADSSAATLLFVDCR